jgi:hypothetical protein
VQCVWNPAHDDSSCYVLQFPNGAVHAGCHHDSCQGKDWQAFKDALGIAGGVSLADVTINGVPASSTGHNALNALNAQGVNAGETIAIGVKLPRPKLSDDAFYGPLGTMVQRFQDNTEADPAATLGCLLVHFGHIVGRSAYVRLDGQRHFLKLFLALIGTTAGGRKGTADTNATSVFDSIYDLMPAGDSMPWSELRHTGLHTGEGLIHLVRDAEYKPAQAGDLNCIDSGIADKRCLLREPEMASVLQRMAREGNTLSTCLRAAWDDIVLENCTKASPQKSTDSHISLIVHCTPAELVAMLRALDQQNGFANRFLWFCSQRSRMIPDARGFEAAVCRDELRQIQETIAATEYDFRQAGEPLEVSLTDEAAEIWQQLYVQNETQLDADEVLGALYARQSQQIRRLAAIFALVDSTWQVGPEHLRPAVALADYNVQTLQYIWAKYGGSTDKYLPAKHPYRMAEAILAAVDGQPLSRNQIYGDVFGRHRTREEIDAALELLEDQGRITQSEERTRGRSRLVITKKIP